MDGGFAPAAGMLADLDLPRKRSFAHFSVDGGPAETCPVEYGSHAKDFLGLRHFSHLIATANRFARRRAKSMRADGTMHFGQSYRGVRSRIVANVTECARRRDRRKILFAMCDC